MRVVAFANNRVGLELVDFLANDPKTDLVGLVVHAAGQAKLRAEIIEASKLDASAVLDAPKLRSEEGLMWLRQREAVLGVSLFFGHILKPEALEVLPDGVLNIHPSYLPYNKGAYPNVWSIVDETPAGATLHVLDRGIDTGAIVARHEIDVRPTDTGSTLYRRLEDACVSLFRDTWPDVLDETIAPMTQPPESGSHHYRKEVEQIDRIDLDETTTARALLNRIRARTFPPYNGCYFEEGGKKVFIRLDLWTEGDEPPQ